MERITKFLPCRLTNDEVFEAGIALAKITQDIKATEDRHTSIKSQLKAELQALESEQRKLAKAVATREEDRNVRVEIVYDYGELSVTEYREDTGQKLSARTMTEAERQIPLPNVQ